MFIYHRSRSLHFNINYHNNNISSDYWLNHIHSITDFIQFHQRNGRLLNTSQMLCHYEWHIGVSFFNQVKKQNDSFHLLFVHTYTIKIASLCEKQDMCSTLWWLYSFKNLSIIGNVILIHFPSTFFFKFR